MGGAASKSARKLPTSVPSQLRPQPKWAGARTPHPDPIVPEGVPPPPRSSPTGGPAAFDYGGAAGSSSATTSPRGAQGMRDTGAEPGMTGRAKPGFSGEKDDAVRRDAMDPQFMANLSKLGPVSINDAGRFIRTPAPAQRTLNARYASPANEDPYAAPSRGTLTAPLMLSLLDRLKSLPAGADPSAVYAEYGMDAIVMRDVRRWVNSPSVGEDEIRVEEGNQIVEMKAIWIDSADALPAEPKAVPPPSA